MGDVMPNPIALASGVLPEFDVEVTIDSAARAGFGSVGLWIEPDKWTPRKVTAVRSALRAHGLSAIDAEVVRLVAGPLPPAQRRMVEIAAEVGAANVLVVGQDPDLPGVADAFAQMCALGETCGVRIALEFMLFSSVRTLDDAIAIVRGAGSPAAALLIDPLHLDRAGYAPGDVAALPGEWLPYAQFCDAPAARLDRDDHVGLLAEARDDRALPGEGVLPLRALLGALPPDIPLSIELRSKELRDAFPDPVERAAAVERATSRFLGAGAMA
ncbi:sugar phosphate isomerase/epimerase [Sphingosinicella ginsenosidimutans]